MKFLQQGSQGQNKCWRQCDKSLADHFHIFWGCSQIQPFWTEVTEVINVMFGLKVDCSFITLYLGKIPDNVIPGDKYLYKVFLVAAKTAITRKWLQANPPSKDDWLAIISEIHCMERLTFSLRLKFDRYIKLWKKWIMYCTDCNPF